MDVLVFMDYYFYVFFASFFVGLILFLFMLCVFCLALFLSDNSVIDVFYGLAFIVVTGFALFATWNFQPLALFVSLLVFVGGGTSVVAYFFLSSWQGGGLAICSLARRVDEKWQVVFFIEKFFSGVYVSMFDCSSHLAACFDNCLFWSRSFGFIFFRYWSVDFLVPF